MKISMFALLALILLPTSASAYEIRIQSGFPLPEIDTLVSGIISNVNIATTSTGGSIYSVTSVSTTGGESASARSRTILNSSAGAGHVRMEIRADEDGVVRTDVTERHVEGATHADIRVASTTLKGSALGADAEAAETPKEQTYPHLLSFFRVLVDKLRSFW